MRLYDRVVAGDWDVPALAMQGAFSKQGVLKSYLEILNNKLPAAARIDVSNVADYWHSDASGTEFDWMMDFPNLAPPFETMWMEYRVPINDRTREEQKAVRALGAIPSTAIGSLILGHPSSNGWGLECFMFTQMADGTVWGGLRIVMILVDAMGAIKEPPKVAVSANVSPDMMPMYADVVDISAMALAISFMHCKNVALEDAPDTRTRQQRRYDERKGTKPTEFKTLVIEPMKQVLRTEGGIERHGLKKALHICRGHFAVYTEEKPLFGKIVGPVWRQAHVRGSAEVGMVGKDYAVKAPRRSA